MNNLNVPSHLEAGFGPRLAEARKSLKKTQAEIGQLLGVRNTAVSKWETGDGPIDERSLISLQAAYGINARWVALGEEPMVLPTWNRDTMREAFNRAAGAPVEGVYLVPKTHGMSPLVETGDILSYSREDLAHGALVLVAPPKVEAVAGGIATSQCRLGRAIRVELEGGKISWRLYRDEDARRPGSFPPLEIDNWQVLGRVTLATRPIR